jgi:hypothetical protein
VVSKDSPKLQQKRSSESSVVRFQKIPRTPQFPLFDLFHCSPPVWPGEGAIARLSILHKAALVETSIGPSHGAVAVHLTGKAMKICHILSLCQTHQTQFQHQQANNTSICPGRGARWFCWLGSSAAQELTWRQIPPKNRFAA